MRDDCGLDEDGGCRNEERWLNSRCILKQVLTRCFDGLYMGCERKKYWEERKREGRKGGREEGRKELQVGGRNSGSKYKVK